MQTVEVVCPSGLKGVLRAMKVKEEGLFGNKALMRQHRIIDKLLEACWEKTLDPGPYRVSAESKLSWERVAAVDRIYAIIQLRMLSYRKDYRFRVNCRNCELAFDWALDLTELDIIEMAPEGVDNLKTGEPIPIQLDNGLQVLARVLVGEDETFLATTDGDDELLSTHLARRIVKIGEAQAYDDVVAAIKELRAADADELRSITDDIEGGVETMFDVQCKGCKAVQKVLLPFEADFFSIQRKSSKSQRRRLRKSG